MWERGKTFCGRYIYINIYIYVFSIMKNYKTKQNKTKNMQGDRREKRKTRKYFIP